MSGAGRPSASLTPTSSGWPTYAVIVSVTLVPDTIWMPGDLRPDGLSAQPRTTLNSRSAHQRRAEKLGREIACRSIR